MAEFLKNQLISSVWKTERVLKFKNISEPTKFGNDGVFGQTSDALQCKNVQKCYT